MSNLQNTDDGSKGHPGARPLTAPVASDPDGWIEWHGGERPVDGRSRVLCRLRNGDVMRRPAMAKSRCWKHSRYMPQYDIIAYRVVPA